MDRPALYFPRDVEWRDWLEVHHGQYPDGIYLIFWKLETNIPTMRWEEAVKVALCYGWIDSTVKSLGGGKRQQYFCPRRPKSNWSKLNKQYVEELDARGMIHPAGQAMIDLAKRTGTWTAMDDVENGVIPEDLQHAFDRNPVAYDNFKAFAQGSRKGYLSWLHQAKREATRAKRIEQIIDFCKNNIKQRQSY